VPWAYDGSTQVHNNAMRLTHYLSLILFLLALSLPPSLFASVPVAVDTDGDGVEDDVDPLPNDGNPSEDWDGDGIQDSIDLDDDNDEVIDTLDEEPFNEDLFISNYTLEQEYNDEREFATEFESSTSGSLSSEQDVDWFKVPITKQEMVNVRFQVSEGPLMYWSVDWYDPDMAIMSGRNLDSTFEYQFPAFKAGEYFVRVQQNAFFDGRSYQIIMEPNLYRTSSEICDGIDYNQDGIVDQDVCTDSNTGSTNTPDDTVETITYGRVYLQTTSTSQNQSLTHLINTSDEAQQFSATLYRNDGEQLGLENQPLHNGTIAPMERVILSSEDIEGLFSIETWSGPAMLEVNGSGPFELMTKLTSPSGLISNTNCVRQNQAHNIEGFDQTAVTYVRFINIGDTPITSIRGSLYHATGDIIGESNPVLIDELPAKAQVWRNRDQLSDIIGDTWNGTASLKIENADDNLRLLNLNFINSETFFNFSCYESGQ